MCVEATSSRAAPARTAGPGGRMDPDGRRQSSDGPLSRLLLRLHASPESGGVSRRSEKDQRRPKSGTFSPERASTGTGQVAIPPVRLRRGYAESARSYLRALSTAHGTRVELTRPQIRLG